MTALRYDLPEDALVNITIYDMMGRIVKNLVSNHQTAGYKSIKWKRHQRFWFTCECWNLSLPGEGREVQANQEDGTAEIILPVFTTSSPTFIGFFVWNGLYIF